MKRILALFLLFVIVVITLCSCGNKSYGFGNYSFKHIHITDAVGGHCADVEKWYECEYGGIEVKTTEYGALWCSEGTYILFESKDRCPYC